MIEVQNQIEIKPETGNSTKPLLPAVYFFVIIFKISLKKSCLCKYIDYLYIRIKNNNTKK